MSKSNFLSVKQSDEHITKVSPYLCDGTPKASILVLHGMAEHHTRYEEFAKALNDALYDVYLFDHRGHGADTKMEDLGFFSSQKGYERVITDAITVLSFVQKEKRTKKLFLFGHSMGSLITRCVIERNDSADAVILCGTTCPNRLTTVGGLLLSSLICFFKGPKYRCAFMNHLLFENKKYLKTSKRTVMDWLTRDSVVVGNYINDPYCGFLCTASFYRDLIKLASIASTPSNLAKTRKELPILLIAGKDDPVGNFGKEVKKLYQLYLKYQFTDVTLKLYEDCRHELLNESNKQDIIKDIMNWFHQK